MKSVNFVNLTADMDVGTIFAATKLSNDDEVFLFKLLGYPNDTDEILVVEEIRYMDGKNPVRIIRPKEYIVISKDFCFLKSMVKKMLSLV